ncbi:MAG: hypothetical protein ACAI44_24695 [Candidatus Sericytochromatia bacterium]
MPTDQETLLVQLKKACDAGHWPQAELWLRKLEQINYKHPWTHFGRGYFLLRRGQLAAARASFAQALAEDPGFREASHKLALIDVQLGQYLQAAGDFEALLQQQPFDLVALQELCGLLQLTGQHAAFQTLGQVLLDPAWIQQPGFLRQPPGPRQAFVDWLPQLEARLLLSTFGADGADPLRMLPLLRHWQRHLDKRRPLSPAYANSRVPGRRLRIGYVSREWGAEPLELGFGMLFARHDPERYELLAYCDQGQPARPQHFAKVQASADWDDFRFYSQIQADGIDILVDLSGFFNSARLLSLALKPAPVQILAGANPPFVTGLPCFDAVFSDRILIPPAIAAHYPERFCYHASFFHWMPPATSPDPGPFADPPRLGALAAPHKLSDGTLRLWAGVLTALPTARLKLKHQTLSDTQLTERIRQRFQVQGGDPSRLDFEDNNQSSDYFSFFQSIDLLLDTHPYAGALSSCDALWMGVPVISLSGGQRIADALLGHLGLEAFLAQSPQDFVRIAHELWSDPLQLAHWRQILRARLQASPLCDGPRQAAEAEADYQNLWQDWLGL